MLAHIVAHVATGLLLSATASVAPAEVPRWEPYELTLRTPRALRNPFWDVHLTCTFVKGDRRVTVDGFYDGVEGNQHLFRVRFAPDEEGTWQYTTASDVPELDHKSGRLTVGKAVTAGGLVRSPQFPRAFFRADGSRFVPLNWGLHPHYNGKGGSDFEPTKRVVPFPSEAEMRAFIDTLAQHELNMFMDDRVLFLRSSTVTDATFYPPFAVKDAATWKIDRDRFNLGYFQRLDRELEHARKRGVFYALQILTSQMVQGGEATWPRSFLNAANGGWIRDKNGDGDADEENEYYALDDQTHQRYVGALLRYTLARTAAFWNVMYRIGGDTTQTKAGEKIDLAALTRWYRHWTAHVRAMDPYRRPLTIGHAPAELMNAVGSDWSPLPGVRDAELADCGAPGPGLGAKTQKQFLEQLASAGDCFWRNPDHSRPVIFYESPTKMWARPDLYELERKAYWVALASGLNFARPDTHAEVMVSTKPPRLFESTLFKLPGQPPILGDLKRLGQFLATANLPLERMAPFRHDGDVYLMASPGNAYLAVLPFGGAADLQLGTGRYEAQFFNPRDGSWAPKTAVEGGRRRFQPPSAGDWVLVVRRADREARRLKIGMVQFYPAPDLAANLAKMLTWIERARREGVRVVVFPEASLQGDERMTAAEQERAATTLREAAAKADVYLIFGATAPSTATKTATTPGHEWAEAIDPTGRVLMHYDKIFNLHDAPVPRIFEIDGVSANAILCADRWLRGVEELPIMKGAQLSFELSNNSEAEWVEALGWYWYVPRALRNNVWVLFSNAGNPAPAQKARLAGPRERKHGHTAIVAPDGRVIAARADDSEGLVTAVIDPAAAHREEALARAEHPLLGRLWAAGVRMLDNRGDNQGHDTPETPPQVSSPEVEVTLAAAQIASDGSIDENVARMERRAAEAARRGADVVAFPELAVTGTAVEQIRRADPAVLGRALARLQAAAQANRIAIVFGMPHSDRGQRFNSAFVVGPDGRLLTRYDQMAVRDGDLFATGTNAQAMWFRLKGAPAVVTIGRDALWSEIAEFTAAAGAQVHLHIANEAGTAPDVRLRRLQTDVNLASFFNLAATVNGSAGGGTALWDHLKGIAVRKSYLKGERGPLDPSDVAIFSTFSASCIARAGSGETILYAKRRLNTRNPLPSRRYNRTLAPWYDLGARLLGAGPSF